MTATTRLPQIGKSQLDFLKTLSDASGVSGAEGPIRDILKEVIKPFADEITEDDMGNLITFKKAMVHPAAKVLLAAHMDEIGLMITVEEGDGLYQFEPVGGIDLRQLAGKAVYAGKKRIPGVIGTRAIHLLREEDMKRAVPLETLRIDVGIKGKLELGDRAVFATEFWENGKSMFGKALDDRLGVATLVEILKNPPENLDLYCAFTTQEEVGLRGARIAAYNIHPDIAIAVDSTPANDYLVNDSENVTYNTRLGYGPAIYTMDRATISDPRLVGHFVGVAEKHQIPYQLRQAGSGGTDAGAMHLQQGGIPAISISVPGRNAHSAIGVARISDWENLLQLLHVGLREFSPDVLKIER
ncbi:MAG: M42 family peptidase [Chloroflexi bacterium]|nr:M42 family peptidase [Chloroflexota bacterium]